MDTNKYILYADDDTDDIDTLIEAFEHFPEYTLLTFKNGIELLAFIDLKADCLDIHLIISDINMPLMNGIETLRALKSNINTKHIPIYLLSTAANEADSLIADAMNTKIFVKPIKLSVLKGIVETMLMKSHE